MSDSLEGEILGPEAKLNGVDDRTMKEIFREWIEPILAVAVALLLVAVVALGAMVLSLHDKVNAGDGERARGSAGVCRLLNALGLDPEAGEDSRCSDPAVKEHWIEFADEHTVAGATSLAVLHVLCSNADTLGTTPPECEGLEQGE